MIEFLATQVLMQNITLDRMPERFRLAVKQRLDEIGGASVIDET